MLVELIDNSLTDKNTPEKLKQYIYVYDLRGNKNRYDDIVFIIDKSKSNG